MCKNTVARDRDNLMTTQSSDTALRQRWLAVLARASTAELEALRGHLEPVQEMQILRRSETGMVMLRGRVGGTGEAFNLGEASVTRCALRLGDSPLGVGYTLGREVRKAELIACFDARLQQAAYRDALLNAVIEPLARKQSAVHSQRSREAASTKVEFYTMVRGEA